MKQTTFTVPAKGVGRADYSTGIEFAVEPTIRSYQQVYSHWETVTVPAGADLVTDIDILGGYVAIVYDFFVTAPVLSLLSLAVDAVSDGIPSGVIVKSGYGSIAEHLPKGFPFFEVIRFTVHNFSDADLEVNIGAVGIYTAETQYYLRLGEEVTP